MEGHVYKGRFTIPSKVINHRLGRSNQPIIYDLSGIVIDNTDVSELFPVFCQTLIIGINYQPKERKNGKNSPFHNQLRRSFAPGTFLGYGLSLMEASSKGYEALAFLSIRADTETRLPCTTVSGNHSRSFALLLTRIGLDPCSPKFLLRREMGLSIQDVIEEKRTC